MADLDACLKENPMNRKTRIAAIVSTALSMANPGGIAGAFAAGAVVAHACTNISGEPQTTPVHESPLACDRLALDAEARKRHFQELGPALRSMKKAVQELPDGYEFQFPSDAKSIALVAEWAAGERLCCPFLQIDLRIEPEHGPFWLRLTGREGVKQFIASDFASWNEQ
jgi:hypothetical protein